MTDLSPERDPTRDEVEEMRDAVVTLDDRERVVDWNRTARDLFGVEGSLDYGLDVDGTVVDNTTVTLAAGESLNETFAWETSADDVGTYTLRVGDETETIELDEPDESEPRTISSDGQSGFGVGVALVGLLFVTFVGLRRR